MAIEFTCITCGQRLRLSQALPGQQARCPQCQTVQEIPGIEPDSPPRRPELADTFPTRTPFSSPSAAAPRSPFADDVTSPDAPSWVQSANPYAAPSGPASYQTPAGHPSRFLASRGKRLLGLLLDTLIHGAAAIPGFVLMLIGDSQNNDALTVVGGIAMAAFLLVIAVGNWVLIANSGQSYAKRILGMRIVRSETGATPGFLYGVFLRLWIPLMINQFCSLFGLIDALWIFNEQRRCVHDLMAGTDVIDTSETF